MKAEVLWTYLPFTASKYATYLITWGKKKVQTSGILTAVCEADDMLEVLNLNLDDLTVNALSVTDFKTKLTQWAPTLYGRYPGQLNQTGIDKYAANI
jgi:alpha-D-ribose 1-methylphosphonate 5-phosphate C-P lyase